MLKLLEQIFFKRAITLLWFIIIIIINKAKQFSVNIKDSVLTKNVQQHAILQFASTNPNWFIPND